MDRIRVTCIPHWLHLAKTGRRSGNLDLVEDVGLVVKPLGFAGFAEVEIGACGTTVADAPDRSHTASVALTTPMHTGVAARVVLGYAEQKSDDVVASTLGLWLVVPVIHAIDYRLDLLGDLVGGALVGRCRGWRRARVSGGWSRAGAASRVPPGAPDGIAAMETAGGLSNPVEICMVEIVVTGTRDGGGGEERRDRQARTIQGIVGRRRKPHGWVQPWLPDGCHRRRVDTRRDMGTTGPVLRIIPKAETRTG